VIEYELLHHSKSLAVAVARFFWSARLMSPSPDEFGLSSQIIHHIGRSDSASFAGQREQHF
jgi:hypothetical protein